MQLNIINPILNAVANEELLPQGSFYTEYPFPTMELQVHLYGRQVIDIDQADFILGWYGDREHESIPTVYWEDIVIWPTINAIVEEPERLKGWNYALAKDTDGLIERVFDATLDIGVVSGKVVYKEQMQVMAKLLFLSMGGHAKRLSNIQSWHRQNGNEVTAASWMFEPMELTHLSPVARLRRQKRIAFGTVRMSNGQFLFNNISKAERGPLGAKLFKAGIPAIFHDKGSYASTAFAELRGTTIFLPAADLQKQPKAFARMMLLSAGGAKSTDEYSSNLLLDGHPAVVGPKVSVAVGTSVAASFSGAALTRKGFSLDVIERRTVAVQLPTTTEITVTMGDIITPGDSVVGVEGISPWKLHHNAYVRFVDIEDNGDSVSQTIKVSLDVLATTTSPKLRGSVKASCHTAVSDDFFNENNIDILLGTEVLKSQLVLLQLYTDTTGKSINITEASIPEDTQADFHAWVAANTKSHTWQTPIVRELIPFLEEAGFKVLIINEELYVEETFDYITGELVTEVETPVTELRATRAAPTMLQWIDMANKYGHDEPGEQRVYSYADSPKLSMEDTLEASQLPWRESLALLADKYPNGAILGNGHLYVNAKADGKDGVYEASAVIDFTAMLAYTSGELHGDDAMSIALYQALKHKLEFGNVVALNEQDSNYWPMLKEASERLANSISFYKSAISGFALGGQLLRDLVRPARTSTLLTARAYNHVPMNEVWISQDTAEEYGIKNAQWYIVSRFPGTANMPAKIRCRTDVPYGVAVRNSLVMQVADSGDVDGDQVLLTEKNAIPSLYNRNHHKRDAATRFLCMMLANMEMNVSPIDGTPGPKKVYARYVNFPKEFNSAKTNYLKHTGLSDSTMVGFFNPKSLETFTWRNGISGQINLNDLRPDAETHPIEAMVDFGTKGVGQAYAMMFNLSIINQIIKDAPVVNSARLLAAAIYEDFALAGYKPTAWKLHTTLSNATAEDSSKRTVAISKWHTALTKQGFKAAQGEVASLFMARAIQTSFNKPDSNAALVGRTSNWQQLIAPCQVFRALSSGQPNNLSSSTQWGNTRPLLGEVSSPLNAIYDTINNTVRLFIAVNETQEDFDEGEHFPSPDSF